MIGGLMSLLLITGIHLRCVASDTTRLQQIVKLENLSISDTKLPLLNSSKFEDT
jgi:hypothetical protein